MKASAAKERIEYLRKEIDRHNELYYQNSQPEISDYDFDQLLAELVKLEREHPEFYDATSPSHRVGSDISNEFVQREHKYPMLSLSNTYTPGEVQEFVDRCHKALGEQIQLCAELKFDGTSISITYQNGVMVHAVTRGDGVRGDDVTNNVKTIRSVPLKIADPTTLEVRGEILLPWKEFDRINEERIHKEEPIFANPRNAASGTLKQLDSRIVASRKLDAYFYALMEDTLPHDSHYANLEYLRSQGFHVSEHTRLCKSVDDVFDFINYWDEKRKSLPVATDGIVLKVDSIRQQQELGLTSKFPRWAIAYKFKAEQASSILREVTFQVGRTGTVTPVANLDPVLLSGTTVRRASLYNEDAIKNLDLHIGDTCFVEKGGEIIPKIVGVDTSKRPTDAPIVQFITHCPECGAALQREEGEAAFFCPNSNHCPPQIQGRIEHFISRRAMNIDGVGPETVVSFLREGLIHSFADLYTLTEDQIMHCKRDADVTQPIQTTLFDVEEPAPTKKKKTVRRFTKLLATKILTAVEKSKQVPFERVLYALGIRYVGETVAKKLAQEFKSLDALMNASYEQLIQVDEIGDRIAKSLIEFFAIDENRFLIAKLNDAGLQFIVAENTSEAQSTILSGKTIVISGVFQLHSRDEYKQIIELNGGKVGSSISAKTSFILAGENMGPSKYEKAQKLNTTILNEQQFNELLTSGENSDV